MDLWTGSAYYHVAVTSQMLWAVTSTNRYFIGSILFFLNWNRKFPTKKTNKQKKTKRIPHSRLVLGGHPHRLGEVVPPPYHIYIYTPRDVRGHHETWPGPVDEIRGNHEASDGVRISRCAYKYREGCAKWMRFVLAIKVCKVTAFRFSCKHVCTVNAVCLMYERGCPRKDAKGLGFFLKVCTGLQRDFGFCCQLLASDWDLF